MAILAENLTYTEKDFDALKLRMQELLRGAFPWWTDFNVANFGNLLVEMFCFVGDVLTFYQDAQAKESRILASTQRKNLLALCRMLGYTPATAAAATANETFSIPAVLANDVIVPSGAYVSTADVVGAVRFQLLAPATITAGLTSVDGTVEHSESWLETFTSTGRPNQEHALPRMPYIDGSADIAAGDGAYTQVVNFLDSGPTDRHYTITVDQTGKALVRFGNGVNGSVPSGTVSGVYKVGGGTVGNVAAGTLIKLTGGFTDVLGNPVSVSATNALPASGGANRETMAQIKQLAPASVRVAGRSVCTEDYEINARRVPGVARALMVTSDDVLGIDENTGRLYIIPVGGGVPTGTLKTAVHTMVTETYPKTITFQVSEYDPIYFDVNVHAIVFLRQGYAAAAVRASIEAALAVFFAVSQGDGTPNPNVDWGVRMVKADGTPANEIAWSDVFNEVRDAGGVRKIEQPLGFLLNDAATDVAIGSLQFPRLGTVELINGDTGLPL